MAATTTVQTIIDNVLAEVGVVSTNSVTGLSTANLTRYVNSAHKELLNHPDLTWDFMIDTYAFDIKADTTVATAVTAAALTATLTETSTWPSSGRAVVEGEEWDFTANASDVLTIPASQASHPAGAEVTLCYAVPSDFQKVDELWIKTASTAVGRGVRYNYLDFRMIDTLRFGMQRGLAFRTSRIDVSGALPSFSNNFFVHGSYIYLPYHTDTRYAFMKYSRSATHLSTTSGAGGILDIPDDQERLFDFIYDTVLARAYKILKRYDRMKEHMALAKSTLDEIVAEHQTKTNKVHAKQVKTYW